MIENEGNPYVIENERNPKRVNHQHTSLAEHPYAPAPKIISLSIHKIGNSKV